MPDRVPDGRAFGRRSFLKTAGVCGVAGYLGNAFLPGMADAEPDSRSDKPTVPSDTVHVRVDPGADASGWTVDECIFGKFIEHNGRDAYPGIYSDHVANGSFEVWNRSGPRTAVLFDVEEYPGVAYGWEPIGEGGSAAFEHAEGGVHGRRAEPDLESGDEIAPDQRPDPAGVDGPRFQRVRIDGSGDRGGVRQLTALPDRRTRSYDVAVSVRGAGIEECAVRLEDPGGRVLAEARAPVTGEWERHEVSLTLDATSGRRYRGSPFGTYALSFVAEGAGRLDLDWVILRSGDAVAGRFNPTTLELLREYNVTSIRWPGGNFASQYHWRDGVGPLADRPVVPNGNWGGLERNYLGTNEWLEFCELAGIEPMLTVGSWSHIPPEEAAAWVEYVNGDRSTEMGRLRAEHGYPEPWDVTAWQVGNEVWGRYQVGHSDAATYAHRYEEYYDAMKAADPRIDIDATGIDPWYTDFDDGGSLTRRLGRPPTWNRILFERAGPKVEGVDIHRYSRGIPVGTVRRSWLSTNDVDPVGYNEMLVNYPTQFGALLGELRGQAADRGVEDLRVTFGEWNLQPKVDRGWPRAGYPTMAHAAFVASMFNTFIRRGDTVGRAYMRDNTLFWRPYPRDMRPVNPGNYVQQFYAEPFVEDDRRWHHLPVDVDCPTLTIPRAGFRIRRMEGVPYVDATAIRSDDGRAVVVYAVNRNLTDTYETAFTVAGWPTDPAGAQARLTLQAGRDGDPFARQTSWDAVDGFERTETALVPDEDGRLRVVMPPASVAKLEIPVDGAGERSVGDPAAAADPSEPAH